MAQQYPDDDQYGAYDAEHYDQRMEERLVEALDFHVQDSGNKALVKALRPFAQPFFNFGVRGTIVCFWANFSISVHMCTELATSCMTVTLYRPSLFSVRVEVGVLTDMVQA
ncbi:hypothetical protein NDU88_000959 [Pleurodeles waltl]|uniref:Uncharacterized protein n=1 Tax=Pleurodeles waltl TaxID=8319 RepID=A0AAV7V8D7_PLEWA|nr:hypothetical protein NDU88_000959 [Pleurodeles waltl]